MKIFIPILTLIITCLSHSINAQQNRIYINEKSYVSTKSLRFIQNGKTSEVVREIENIYLGIGKNGKSGILLLEKYNNDFFNKDYSIGGTLLIILENGDVIKCIDRNIYGYIDDKASVVYYLTSNELNMLKQSNIASLSYSVWSKGNKKFSTKNFSARNTEETAYHIEDLFNQ